MGAAVDSLGTLSVSTTTLAGATGTCFKGTHGDGGLGGSNDNFTKAADGSDGSDGSQCAPGGEVGHSGSFTTLAPGDGEPVIPPFPSGGGSTGPGPGGGGGSGSGGGSTPPTPSPPSTLPSPLPKVIPFVGLHGKKFVVTGRTLTLAVTCAAGGPACSEKLSLTASGPLHATAKKLRKVKLGSARLTVAAGHSAKVKVKLTRTALALLKKAHGHRLKATVTISAGGRTQRRSVTLALARAKRH